MATVKPKTKANSPKQPLRVKLLNASGQVIEGLIPSGHRPRQNPALAIAKELSKHKHLKPTPIP